jgi:4-amino-4-deoxy-L-arabinose transferase-like glycosyltransferase
MMLRRHAALLIATASLLVNMVLVAQLGVRHGGDTPRYLSGAKHLLNGEPFQEKEGQHAGYLALVALSLATTGSATGVVVLQILAAAAAASAVFLLGRELFGFGAALIAAALFILNVDSARWNSYVLTDSLYISFVILATLTIEKARTGSVIARVAVIALLAFAVLLRPNGWVMVLVAVLYWIGTSSWTRARRAMAATAFLVLLVAMALQLGALRQGLEKRSPQARLREGTVIWGYAAWRVPMPADETPVGDVADGVRYALRHPLACARLALTRVGVELSAMRPYYSRGHNALVLLLYGVTYLFACYGIPKATPPLRTLLLAVIAAHLLLVAISWADWDGRSTSCSRVEG